MFLLARMKVGQTPPIVYIEGTASESFALGEALVISGGKLTKCGAAAAPSHIAVGPAGDDGLVPAIEVQPYMEFETVLTAAGTALAVGDKLTLSEDGLYVTATTGGVAEITTMFGTAPGSAVRVKF